MLRKPTSECNRGSGFSDTTFLICEGNGEHDWGLAPLWLQKFVAYNRQGVTLLIIA
jgi:hypothetical protein